MHEIQTQLLIALDLDYIQSEEQQNVNESLETIIKVTSKFKSTLK